MSDPLNPGRRVGVGRDQVDLAIDSVDGVSLVAKGLSQALSIAAAAETGGIAAPPPCAYLHKLAVGPRARGAIDIADSPENNLRRIAFAMDVQVQDLTVMLLDRPRHQGLLERVRALGSRLVLISDGDIAAALMTAWPGSGIDVLIGSGGTAEAVLAACALRCLGGEMQCRPWVRNQEKSAALSAAGHRCGGQARHRGPGPRQGRRGRGHRCDRWRPGARRAVPQLVGRDPQPGDARSERDGPGHPDQASRRPGAAAGTRRPGLV